MRFYSKTVTLKDGRTAVLRAPEVADAAELLNYLKDVAAETEFILRTPEECNISLEAEERFVRGLNESDTDMMIVCEVEGRMAGNCQISFKNHAKTRHRASVAIALRRSYWGMGIGTALMTELIAAARKRGLIQLELEFLEGNSRARALYEKMGFRIVGMRPNAYRLSNGELRHEYIMVLEL